MSDDSFMMTIEEVEWTTYRGHLKVELGETCEHTEFRVGDILEARILKHGIKLRKKK